MDDRYFDNCKGIPLELAGDLCSPNFKQTYEPMAELIDILSGEFRAFYSTIPEDMKYKWLNGFANPF